MYWIWNSLRALIFFLVLPLLISSLVAFVVRGLVGVGFFYSDEGGVMVRIAGILVDLVLQSAYFLTLIVLTRRHLAWAIAAGIVLLVYQSFMAGMFLRGGTPTLVDALSFLIESNYLKLTAPFK